MIEQTLVKMADKILHLDEASLVNLWDKYRLRMEQADMSRDWEQAVIIFFIINAVRAKNEIFNEQILTRRNKPSESAGAPPKPSPNTKFRLIKPDK